MDHCAVCGTPLPEMECEACGALVCADHIEEHTNDHD
jgi:predicted nucleic acid-binding Zn ribbon protein